LALVVLVLPLHQVQAEQ